jgi:hypothetical protein
MTENEKSAADQNAQPGERRSPGKAGLLPKVTFGLGTAVLAGAVAVAGPAAPAATGAAGTATVTVGLGAVINAITGTGMAQTTCCGGRLSAFLLIPVPIPG